MSGQPRQRPLRPAHRRVLWQGRFKKEFFIPDDYFHYYDPEGPYLSIYSQRQLYIQRDHQGNRQPKFYWKLWADYNDEKFTLSKHILTTLPEDNHPVFTKQPVQDWFEPGTPRQ